jgi:hypothetical protein
MKVEIKCYKLFMGEKGHLIHLKFDQDLTYFPIIS